MKAVPNFVWGCLVVIFVAVVGSFTYLAGTGAPTEEFSRFMNSVMNFAALILSGTAAALAGKSATQTNGGLDERIKEAARQAIEEASSDGQ